MKNKRQIKSYFKTSGKTKGFYNFSPKSSTANAEILIYDEIGYFGVNSEWIAIQLKEVDGEHLNVRINSPGGDVFDGLAIMNLLKARNGTTTIHIDGLAASIASIIALGGDELVMSPDSWMMIHEAWSFAIGDADELRKQADVLEKISNGLADIYERESAADRDDILQMMKDETWLSAAEACEIGFCAYVDDENAEAPEEAAKAAFDLGIYDKAPEVVTEMLKGCETPPERQMEQALRDAGASRKEAKMIVSGMDNLILKLRNM